MINWNDLLAALALVFIIEGILPFLRPASMRRLWQAMVNQSDSSLRTSGFISMLIGLGILYLVN